MRASPEQRQTLFRVLSLAFVGGAIFHALALARPSIAEPVPAHHHVLFVFVNLALAVLVVRRPRGFPIVFGLYMVQQYVEHLPRCITVWREHHRFDAPGFAPLVFVPFVLALLVWDARARARGA